MNDVQKLPHCKMKMFGSSVLSLNKMFIAISCVQIYDEQLLLWKIPAFLACISHESVVPHEL